MKRLIISEQIISPQKLDLKKISTRLKLHVWNLKASHALLDFPQKCFYELSGLSKEGLQKFKRTDKKSDQDFHIDWFDTKELIACA